MAQSLSRLRCIRAEIKSKHPEALSLELNHQYWETPRVPFRHWTVVFDALRCLEFKFVYQFILHFRKDLWVSDFSHIGGRPDRNKCRLSRALKTLSLWTISWSYYLCRVWCVLVNLRSWRFSYASPKLATTIEFTEPTMSPLSWFAYVIGRPGTQTRPFSRHFFIPSSTTEDIKDLGIPSSHHHKKNCRS